MTLLPWLMPVAVVVVAALCGVAAQAVLRSRDGSFDTGELWARMLSVVGVLGVAVWLSTMAESFQRVWVSGWHFLFDRVRSDWWAYPAALALPLVAWLVVIGVSLAPRMAPSEGQWVAGTVGRPATRRWLLAAAAVPALLVWVGGVRLNEGASGYPAATWTTTALTAVTLIFLAFSGRRHPLVPAQEPEEAVADPLPALPGWFEAMRGAGIALHLIATFRPRLSPRTVRTQGAIDLELEVDRGNAGRIAPELTELFAGLLGSKQLRGSRAALALAPDGCGQVELLAHTARELFLLGNEATLVIVPRPDRELVRHIERALPEFLDGQVSQLDSGVDVPPDRAFVWIVDAQTLSERFLEHLRQSSVADRIGLVVWWGLDAYTGVFAANVWAIARRFHRLMVRRRPDVRTIVLARDSPHADAQMGAFVRRLLPYEFPDNAQARVEQGPSRDVSVYRLDGHADRFSRSTDEQWPPPDRRLVSLVAALASLEAGWPTFADAHGDVQDEERRDVIESREGTPIGANIMPGPEVAGARIRAMEDGELLALPAIVGQGGRASRPGIPHNVGITVTENPYASFVAERLGSQRTPAFGAKRLVAADHQASIVERHLLAAIRERPDVEAKLRASFSWEDQVIQRTLENLYKDGQLSRETVRYLELDPAMRPRPRGDFRYRNLLPPADPRPLDSVGNRLVAVRDPAAANRDDKGVRMRVDPERVTIQAYPGRVFMSGGERYRIRDWTDAQLREVGWLECQRDARVGRTWRVREATVAAIGLRPGHAPVDFRPARAVQMTRASVDVTYRESVSGAVWLETDLTTGRRSVGMTDQHVPVQMPEAFPTSGLVLYFHPEPDWTELSALALALSYVLPVHIGVEQDALEVVPVHSESLAGPAAPTVISGVVIVDLYPRGIGLVKAVGDDQALLLDVLTHARDWLVEVKRNPTANPLETVISRANFVGISPLSAAPLLTAVLGADDSHSGYGHTGSAT